MFLVNRSRLISSLFSLALLAGAMSSTACVEAGLQSGVFACNADSECPPGGFFCDNYFNTYMYYSDVTARPVKHDYWGFCNSENEVIEKEGDTGRVHVEICANDQDDDGDGDADCVDLECQTSPTCRALIDRECDGGAGAPEYCANRLGFPLIRNEALPTEETCPRAVGYFGAGIEAEFDNPCLPRCRLYFLNNVTGMPDNSDGLFFGSDRYCNTVVDPNLITASRFEGGLLTCEHVNMQLNGVSLKVQNDVCLPPQTSTEAAMTNCDTCNDVTHNCMIVTFKDRTKLAWNNKESEVIPLGTYTLDQVRKTRVYCMEK